MANNLPNYLLNENLTWCSKDSMGHKSVIPGQRPVWELLPPRAYEHQIIAHVFLPIKLG